MMSSRHRLCFLFDGNDEPEGLQPLRSQFEVLYLKVCSTHPLSHEYIRILQLIFWIRERFTVVLHFIAFY